MIQEGSVAPDFTLPGSLGGFEDSYTLTEQTEKGNAILLLFYPFDFSPVCTNELCAIRDAEWFDVMPDVDVWALSGDSVHAHRAFAEAYNLEFPLLSDFAAEVAEAYDIRYDEWEDHTNVPKRAVFLVDADRRIRYAWSTDDALEKPDFFPVSEAVNQLAQERDDADMAGLDLAVEYESVPDVE